VHDHQLSVRCRSDVGFEEVRARINRSLKCRNRILRMVQMFSAMRDCYDRALYGRSLLRHSRLRLRQHQPTHHAAHQSIVQFSMRQFPVTSLLVFLNF
jgi:hypothetical protein